MFKSRKRPVARVAFSLMLLLLIAPPLSSEETSPPTKERPLPAIDTQLSTVKGVSILRVEEADSDDDNFFSGRQRQNDMPLLDTLSEYSRLSEMHIFGKEFLPGGSYRIVIKKGSTFGTRKKRYSKLATAYEAAFGIKIVREKRKTPIFVLLKPTKTSPQATKPLKKLGGSPSSTSISTSTGGEGVTEVVYTGSLKSFADYLEEEFGEIVINGTGINWRVKLEFDHETVPDEDDEEYETYDEKTINLFKARRLEDITAGLKKYGLDLKKSAREIDGIFISPDKSAASQDQKPQKDAPATKADDKK